MKIFKDYARFYDDLYKDKDYKKECRYLEKIFKKYSSKKIKTILDLGCGTGSHDIILTKQGYQVTGVDLSKEMLTVAKTKKEDFKIDFCHSDIRKLSLKKRFDAIISMFNVMGYQTTNDDFEKALLTVNKHLKRSGLFVFDVWFGPAVLSQKPKDEIKKVKLKNGYIIRQTKPQLNLLKQTVDVCFKTKYYTTNNRLQKLNKETHKMRFFFYQELVYFIQRVNFKVLSISPFLKLKGNLSEKDWNISVVAQKK